MMGDVYSNIDARLLVKLKVFAAELAKRNIRADPCNGFRSMTYQAQLYAKGRTTKGPKVTKAKPGQSPHNFGMAMDFIPFVGHRTYHVKPVWWLKFGLAAKAAGLTWGGSWKKFLDRPHVELPGWRKLK
jgi:peptidoglycan LD-endopeptidase CwlK